LVACILLRFRFCSPAVSGKLNTLFQTPLPELVVNELAAAITVHALEGEGQGISDVDDVLLDPAVGAVTGSPYFDPAGGDVGEGYGAASDFSPHSP
jgi:hypothetical protein